MTEEATVYCGSCGGKLTESARFCRSCGTAQEPVPALAAALPREPVVHFTPAPIAAPPPAVPALRTAAGSPSSARTIGALLALAGGIGASFMVLWAIVYEPLHYHSSVNYGVGIQFGDILAFAAGVIGIVLGTLTLRRRATSGRRVMGAVAAVAGLSVLILVLVWAFASDLGIETFLGRPFYFGLVYFSTLGQAHIGSSYDNGFVQIPSLASSVGILLGGVMVAATRERHPGAHG